MGLFLSKNGISAGWEPLSRSQHYPSRAGVREAGAFWGRSGGSGSRSSLAPKRSGLGSCRSLQYLSSSSGSFMVPTPLSSSSGMCTQRALTSAGRSLARLQGDRCSHPWGQPQTPWQHPQGTAASPSHHLWGDPRSWGTSVATPTPSPCPLQHLLPMLLSPREAGKSEGIERTAAPAWKSHRTEQQGQQHGCLNKAPIYLVSKRSFPFCCPCNAKGRWVQGMCLVKN